MWCPPIISVTIWNGVRSLFSKCEKENKVVSGVSRLSYGIYLMHIFVLGSVYQLFEGMMPTWFTIITMGVSTFLVSCVIAKLLSYLPHGKYIVG